MDASHVYVGALALGCFHSHICTGTLRRALTVSLDSCAEIKIKPFSGVLNLAQFGGRCRKAMLGVCPTPSPPAHPLHLRHTHFTSGSHLTASRSALTFKPASECVVHTVIMKSSPQTPADLSRSRVPIPSCAMSRRDTLFLSSLVHKIQSLDL